MCAYSAVCSLVLNFNYLYSLYHEIANNYSGTKNIICQRKNIKQGYICDCLLTKTAISILHPLKVWGSVHIMSTSHCFQLPAKH